MRILHWNILHGGGSRRMPEIVLSLLAHRPDIVVLTEYRVTIGGQIRGVLGDHGLVHQLCTDPPKGKNGVVIASRWPLLRVPTPELLPAPLHVRWLDAQIAAGDGEFFLTGVHIPDDSRPSPKAAFWRQMLVMAEQRCAQRHLFIGDFNTGRHRIDEAGASFGCTSLLGAVCTLGYADAFRHFHPERREWTWLPPPGDRATPANTGTFAPPSSGFRIDSALVSGPLMPALRAAFYSHSERETAVSDHSAMLVDLEISAPEVKKCADSAPETAIF